MYTECYAFGTWLCPACKYPLFLTLVSESAEEAQRSRWYIRFFPRFWSRDFYLACFAWIYISVFILPNGNVYLVASYQGLWISHHVMKSVPVYHECSNYPASRGFFLARLLAFAKSFDKPRGRLYFANAKNHATKKHLLAGYARTSSWGECFIFSIWRGAPIQFPTSFPGFFPNPFLEAWCE